MVHSYYFFATDTNKLLIVSEHGIVVILEIMRRHRISAEVQECCCGLLRNLSTKDALRTLIAEENGIEGIISALNLHYSTSYY